MHPYYIPNIYSPDWLLISPSAPKNVDHVDYTIYTVYIIYTPDIFPLCFPYGWLYPQMIFLK